MKYGNKEDSEVINYAICSGVKGIFTAHGSSLQDLKFNPEINKLINLGIFQKIIFLDDKQKGVIKKVI
jgi:stage III sporulation protein SpoIIIAA